MFAIKLSCFAALALAPWAQALFLQLPVNWQSSSLANISWTNNPTDPPFTLQLVNTDEFHDTFSIANNVNPSADFASFTLPVIPQGSYTLRAINVTNAGQIFDETPTFTIQGPPETSHSSAATTSAASATGSASATLTVPASSGSHAGATSSGFGVTVSGSATNGASATNAASSTASSAATTPASFNNGAASLPNLAPWAVAALGMVAGAAAAL